MFLTKLYFKLTDIYGQSIVKYFIYKINIAENKI